MEDAPIVTQTPTLSKKELKRQRKREFYQEQKKQRKLAKTGKVNNDNQSENDNESEDQQHEAKEIELNLGDNNQVVRSEKKQAKINKYIDGCRENFHIIIDCDWEKEHTDSTLTSLTQQIMFCYGISRRSSKPVFIHISNLKERTRANLHAIKFENWTGVTYSEEDYINDERYCPSNAQETEDNNSNKKELVYLTADAEETITELDPNCAYILGGIVDRNRLKGVTYEKAKRQKVNIYEVRYELIIIHLL